MLVTLFQAKFFRRRVGHMSKSKVKQDLFVSLHREAFHLLDKLGNKVWS